MANRPYHQSGFSEGRHMAHGSLNAPPRQLWLMPSRKSNGELILFVKPYSAHLPSPDGAGWTSSTWKANKYRRNIYRPQGTSDFQTRVAQPSEVKSGNRQENGR